MNLVTLRRSQSQQKMAEPPEPKAQKYHVWTGFFAKIPQKVVKSLESFGTLTVLFLEAKTLKKRFFFSQKIRLGTEFRSLRRRAPAPEPEPGTEQVFKFGKAGAGAGAQNL